ncbi:Crp/Fnr family transcriptional regulator [Epilithonimonas sp. JDS]|uniref:Crp/Fnr family transcriptional regulator n=1 Tax=Epilithonimonas sp. JDS TaxID=2902797 RepID=UPI001E52B910|nr:Crp/Fnr family transcriptional regulator [Epilithonimonas sp. JDS]MCD9855873.1 Crp/Fnr family transcriptional regulator [Epilithonimonas sp. JDS]
MNIDEQILKSSGGKVKDYNAGDFIFTEGSLPNYYYQIIEGEVKLNNLTEDGKESIQNIAAKGQSIGEFLLFINKKYPANAVAISPCKILRISKIKFLKMLEDNADLKANMIKNLADSLFSKFVMRQIISIKNPATKLKVLMDYLKSSQSETAAFSFQIPLTRQQMASLTGLRVETTIRTLKIMEKENIVKIKNRKIFY